MRAGSRLGNSANCALLIDLGRRRHHVLGQKARKRRVQSIGQRDSEVDHRDLSHARCIEDHQKRAVRSGVQKNAQNPAVVLGSGSRARDEQRLA